MASLSFHYTTTPLYAGNLLFPSCGSSRSMDSTRNLMLMSLLLKKMSIGIDRRGHAVVKIHHRNAPEWRSLQPGPPHSDPCDKTIVIKCEDRSDYV